MHIPTHILSGWLLGNCVQLNAKQRCWCMFAAAAADIDGLGILHSQEAYVAYHHVLGHNLVAALVVAGLAAVLFTDSSENAADKHIRLKMFIISFIAMHLHLLCDIMGSGRASVGYCILLAVF